MADGDENAEANAAPQNAEQPIQAGQQQLPAGMNAPVADQRTVQMIQAPMNMAIPAQFTLQGDTVTQWKSFRQKFKIYMLACGGEKRTAPEKVAMLLTIGGDVLINIYNSFEWTNEAEENNYASVVDKFNNYFIP